MRVSTGLDALHTSAQLDSSSGQAKAVASPVTERFGRTLEITDALKSTLRDEHCCYLKAEIMIWKQIYKFWQARQKETGFTC